MIGEMDVGGVFAPTLLLWAAVALAVSVPLRRGLDRIGAYRFVWHRGLFDIALVLILWTVAAKAAALFTFPN
jgi:hypothetical protein